MYFDFLNYQKFYDSTIGNSLSSHIESKLKKSCCLYEKQNIGCFGFCFPYLNFLKNYNSPISYCYPKKMGISEKLFHKFYKILIDEDNIPFQDSHFDHIFSIHYLENVDNTKICLRELWRVLSPEGQLYLIIPNKKSSWHLSDKSPFSSGIGFSKNQISSMLDDSFFEIQFIDRLVYFPNTNLRIIRKNKDLIDKFGSIFFKFFNGVYLCVIKKKIHASITSRLAIKKNLIKSIIKNT